MSRTIFINLAVKDVPTSKAFYGALGFSFNPQFSTDQGACVVISEHIRLMLLSHELFMNFSPLPIADSWKVKEVLNTLSCESRAEVDSLVAKAIAAGGSTPDAAQDHGFMYDHSFMDPDGHAWGVAYMDMSQFPATPQSVASA
ncbi:MAG: glyoxalase/bleomycin resistance/extradiol dioxygenase family protein [Phycisphaerales bacterium]|nr:glyoxalase/bleomycin resistance/extradiol dioxygenase family protein [Phycisphaerales bacterium]